MGTLVCFCFPYFPTSLLVTPYSLQQWLQRSSGFMSRIPHPLAVAVWWGLPGGSQQDNGKEGPRAAPSLCFQKHQNHVSPSRVKPMIKVMWAFSLPSPSSFLLLFHPIQLLSAFVPLSTPQPLPPSFTHSWSQPKVCGKYKHCSFSAFSSIFTQTR